MRSTRTEHHVSNSRLIDLADFVDTQDGLTRDAFMALIESMPSTFAAFGRAGRHILKAAQDYEKAQARFRLYGAGVKTTLGAKVEPIIFDEQLELKVALSSNKDLHSLSDSFDPNSPFSGGCGDTKRGPRRNVIQRSKDQLMKFRAFVSKKVGGSYRDQQWRRG